MRRTETGAALVDDAIVYALGDFAIDWISAGFRAIPEHVDRPFPFRALGPQEDDPEATWVPELFESPAYPVSKVYQRAFERLDAIEAGARECGLTSFDLQAVHAARGAVAQLLNAGVYQWTPGPLSPFPSVPMFVAEPKERPTFGQVEAAFQGFADKVDRLCKRVVAGGLLASASAASAPEAPSDRKIVGLSPLGVAVLSAVVVGGFLVWRSIFGKGGRR